MKRIKFGKLSYIQLLKCYSLICDWATLPTDIYYLLYSVDRNSIKKK